MKRGPQCCRRGGPKMVGRCAIARKAAAAESEYEDDVNSHLDANDQPLPLLCSHCGERRRPLACLPD
eukprot:3632776-Rhodomonas_salina.2